MRPATDRMGERDGVADVERRGRRRLRARTMPSLAGVERPAVEDRRPPDRLRGSRSTRATSTERSPERTVPVTGRVVATRPTAACEPTDRTRAESTGTKDESWTFMRLGVSCRTSRSPVSIAAPNESKTPRSEASTAVTAASPSAVQADVRRGVRTTLRNGIRATLRPGRGIRPARDTSGLERAAAGTDLDRLDRGHADAAEHRVQRRDERDDEADDRAAGVDARLERRQGDGERQQVGEDAAEPSAGDESDADAEHHPEQRDLGGEQQRPDRKPRRGSAERHADADLAPLRLDDPGDEVEGAEGRAEQDEHRRTP